jgi:hypothetical protein
MRIRVAADSRAIVLEPNDHVQRLGKQTNQFYMKNCIPLSPFFAWLVCLPAAWFWTCSALASDPIPSLDVRFKTTTEGTSRTDEVPDFQRHISPLLGRLGCNGRACHGSFQGQGGFMLSLFGYDFDLDHKALFDEKSPRIDLKAPLESLILTKPVDADMHEGGQRFKKGGWEYAVLRSWIEAGALKKPKGVTTEQKLVSLDVSPLEVSFDAAGKKQALKAVAVWQDGTKEDVTSLCRFFSNDTSIAQIDEHGVVTGGERGDTHVVVAYDNAVVPVSILRPSGPAGELQTQIANSRTDVDRLVLAKLDKLGVKPSDLATDAEFFRRVSLDMTGTLPTSAQVRSFLEDASPEKRSKIVESLLNSPGYAALWATFLCDVTGNNDDQLNNFSYLRDTQSQQWYQWIYDRVARNVPYDDIVEGIVTAVSREPGESYRDYCEAMTNIAKDKTGKSFAQRSDMMYYWARNNQKTAEERAISFAYAFCGVRIQCAQCHKHPFDQWSKKDFDQFEKLFDGVQANQNTMQPDAKPEIEKMIAELGIAKSLKGNQLAKEIQQKFAAGLVKDAIPFPEVLVKVRDVKKGDKDKDKKAKKQPAPKSYPTARLLGGDYVDLSKVSDPREPLMEWLRLKNNPYFAKAIVNRIWAHYFQVGIVNPADDLNLANAPSNAELLDYLANGFIDNHYDLKWLHRTIVNTDTYQRSWTTNPSNELDRRNFSHALLRRLPAETAYDALRIALSSDKVALAMCNLESERAMTLPGASARNRNGKSSYALSVFGRSIRESNCDCDRTSDPSLLQTVFIRNDADVLKAITEPKVSWLSQVAAEHKWELQARNDSGPEPAAKSSAMMNDPNADKEQKIADELDKNVRKFRAQIAKLEGIKDSGEKIRSLKSRLALNEKRLSEQLALIAKKSEQSPTKVAAEEKKSADSVAQVESHPNAEMLGLIEEAYLRTLSRKPTPFETQKSQLAIAQAGTPITGLSDLLWALINSKEFILNH